ncbi:hypothetical protein KDA_09180 [Dictyobacter alpinus]|uniref:BsuBI/PstI restriction endonuclease domain-containing protein n=1 Tax=Dictyobacter alpinus TaxID=2014873 RepID=A0A402B250_9CHLR|nr:BsuBI/PstI family type II restriction endonuclease [Dictyobacter alpinus]GCE25434.1 hypothetical protein KDA_09180 [Dictyobacter alpinus]
MQRIHNTTLKQLDGSAFSFAPPGPERHNSLLIDTVELFSPRYAPNAYILHLQDPANTIAIHECQQLTALGIQPLSINDLPDILLYQARKQVLYCIDVCTLHGVISNRRKQILEHAMEDSPLRRIYISACYDLLDYKQSLDQIAWGSYIWLAHMPEHTIFHW